MTSFTRQITFPILISLAIFSSCTRAKGLPSQTSTEFPLNHRQESVCSYEGEGEMEKTLSVEEVIEKRVAQAKLFCDKKGGVNFTKSKITAIDRFREDGAIYIAWAEEVYCYCNNNNN